MKASLSMGKLARASVEPSPLLTSSPLQAVSLMNSEYIRFTNVST